MLTKQDKKNKVTKKECTALTLIVTQKMANV